MDKRKQYPAIQTMIRNVQEAFGAGHKISEMFETCISNTLETTIKRLEDGSIFVITGDIPAMWLRDSSCQLRPFLLFAKEEPEIKTILTDLIKKQTQCIQIDPYANAFNESANGCGHQEDHTDMKPELWERKYEIDSLCFPFKLSYLLWKNCGAAEQFDENWKKAARLAVDTFLREQDHEKNSDYRFERENCIFTDTLSRDGKGALVKGNIGLTWSGFRPSDDACVYGYLIPSNMLAVVVLKNIAEISREIYHDLDFSREADTLADTIQAAIEEHAVVKGEASEFYAYEVDGYGQYHIMDDANLPSLLSMPYIGYCEKTNPVYQNTRKVVLSDRNPYYYKGTVLEGVGSPHTPTGFVWTIALCMQGITSDSEEEKKAILEMLCSSDAGTNLMHESICVNDDSQYTRPWFSWANSVFCEFVMDYLGYSVKNN